MVMFVPSWRLKETWAILFVCVLADCGLERVISSKRGVAIEKSILTADMHNSVSALASWVMPVGTNEFTLDSFAAWAHARVQYVDLPWANSSFRLTIYEGMPRAGQKSAVPSIRRNSLLTAEVGIELWKHIEVIASSWHVDVLVSFDPASWDTVKPTHWLLDFFGGCASCKIDAIALRDTSCHTDDLARHLDLYRPFGKPLWLMDVGCEDSCSVDYLREAVVILESDHIVEKFAWRNVGRGSLGTEDAQSMELVTAAGVISEVGEVFGSISVCQFESEANKPFAAPPRSLQHGPNFVAAQLGGLKAVHYAPRMTGLTFLDPLNPILTRIFLRDIKTIAEEIGGDTIVLAAPSESLPKGGTWVDFLNECRDHNISVIPSFSMRYFTELGISSSEMSSVFEEAFDNFLRYFMEGTRDLEWGEPWCTAGGSLHPAVKGWLITDLPTMETLVSGSRRTIDGLSSVSDESVLARITIRVGIRTASGCVTQMYGRDSIMGLAVSLDTPNAKANTTFFQDSMSVMLDSFERSDFEGNFFDFWVLEVNVPPIQASVNQALSAITMVSSTDRKPIIPQIGIAAAIPEKGTPILDVDLQQSLLLEAHDVLVNFFIGSLIVFQFSDDWGATEALYESSCEEADSSLMQSACGTISGLVDDTTIIAVEYMGLSSHTNWFLHACIEPRWLDVDEAANGFSGLISEGTPSRREGTFSFNGGASDGSEISTCVLISYMDVVVPPELIEAGLPRFFYLLVLISILALCCGCCKTRALVRKLVQSATVSGGIVAQGKMFDNDIGSGKYRFQRQQQLRHKVPRQQRISTSNTTLGSDPTDSELLSPVDQAAEFNRSSVHSVHSVASKDLCLKINAFEGDPLRNVQDQVSLQVQWTANYSGRNVEFLLINAWAVQHRILEHHIMCEERCEGRAKESNTFHRAIENVHGRALEGYFLWSTQMGYTQETLDDVDMFKHTLMLYMLQAISEQLLHTPEVVNALYHILVKGKKLRYDVLCRTLEEYKDNSDPYGGLMLDDINDAVGRSLRKNISIEDLEHILDHVTHRNSIRKLVYPQRGLTAAVKLLADFRCFAELKALVGYMAYGTFTGDIRWRPQEFFDDITRVHGLVHATLEFLALCNFFYIAMHKHRFEQFVRTLLGFCISMAVVFVGLDSSEYVGPAYLALRLLWLLFCRNNGYSWLPFLRAPLMFPVGRPHERIKAAEVIKITSFKQRFFYWVCVLGFCYGFEVLFVFQVLEGISPVVLCASRCERLVWRSKCIACNSAVAIMYVMIGSLLCVDVLMGQVLFTCVFGIKLGFDQGINGMRKSADNAVFLSDTTRGLGKDNPRAGCLMRQTFGNNWRSIWNLLCYRLWKEDLLNMAEADELMRMALKEDADKNRDTPLHLSNVHSIVRERLSFFFASLRFICEDERRRYEKWSGYGSQRKFVHHGIYRTHDVIPLSQNVPAVNEEVILSEAFLKEENGINLRWVIGKYRKEWEHLTARLSEKNLLNRFIGVDLPPVSTQALQEIRLWASMRSQTVLRTVQGAVNYHIALESNPTVVMPHSGISKRSQLDQYVELIWAHQTHGDNNARDRDVRWTLMEYEDYPIFLVFDLDMLHLSTMDRKVMGRMVKLRLEQEIGEPLSNSDFEAFFDDFPHVSCKATYKKRSLPQDREDYVRVLSLTGVIDQKFIKTQVDVWDPMSVLNLDIIEATPRRAGLMIGKNKLNLTQGKAGNQLNALRLSRGFAVQAMDANMGSFIGEAFKVSTVLKYFKQPGMRKNSVRMIGFREHIFTVSHGVCGDINAVAEWSFGTIIQRVQAWLGVRMHYGHPDFVDLFWARSRGGMSKASPHINLSEDIFAGLNVKNRGERSEHVDILEYEKGREVSFNAASTFLYKISAGNVGVWRSKDLSEAVGVMCTVDQMSFYFATVGYFVSLTIIDCTVYLFLAFHILLAMASISLHELGSLGTALSTEWIWGPSVFMYLPPLMEGMLEFGGLVEALKRLISGFDPMAELFPAGILYWLLTLIFFTFQNKTKSAAVRQALTAGTASYKATGRPNANQRLTLLDTFLQYRGLHFKDGVVFLFYYILYRTANLGLAGALPMFSIVFSAVCWLVVPAIFSPYPSWERLTDDVTVFYDFLMRCPADRSRTELLQPSQWLTVSASGKRPAVDVPKAGSRGQPGNLFELLFRDAQDKDQKLSATWDQDIILLITSLLRSGVLLLVLPATITESFEFWSVVWVLHCFLALVLGFFLELFWILVIFLVYIVAFSKATNFPNICLALLLVVQLLDTVSHVLMTASRFIRRLPGQQREVSHRNVQVGLQVMPGKDWMYDMKSDDMPQNAAQGSSMVGEVSNIDGKEEGYCEVKWLTGVEGRYRIATRETSAADLVRYPDYPTIALEASILLFGRYHLNLVVAFVVLIAHSLVVVLLIIIDMPCFGSMHSRMLRLPTKFELDLASSWESGVDGGAMGAPPIAMTEREDEVRIEDLQRGPWNKQSNQPPSDPAPPAHVLDDPSYRGAEWRAMCRIKLTKAALDVMSSRMDIVSLSSGTTQGRPSAQDLRKQFQIVPVSVQNRDGRRCGLDAPLEPNSYILFGFENTSTPGPSHFNTIRVLVEEKPDPDADFDPSEFVDRVWLPVYKFDVPKALCGVPWQAHVDGMRSSWDSGTRRPTVKLRPSLRTSPAVTSSQPATDKAEALFDEDEEDMLFIGYSSIAGIQAPEIVGLVRNNEKRWFPAETEVVREDDQIILSQGSLKGFALTWARARLGSQCLSTGSKLVYGMTLPKPTAWSRSGPAGIHVHVLNFVMGFRLGLRTVKPAPINMETGEPLLDTAVGDLGVLASYSATSRGAYRASRMYNLWPFGAGISMVGVHSSPPKKGKLPDQDLLFAFHHEKPDDKSLARFFGMSDPNQLDTVITSRWVQIFNFAVPTHWIGKSVMEIARKEEIVVWGISRPFGSGTRVIWFPGPGLKDKEGEHHVELYGESDEIILPLWSAFALMTKYFDRFLPKTISERFPAQDTVLHEYTGFNWMWLSAADLLAAKVLVETNGDSTPVNSVALGQF